MIDYSPLWVTMEKRNISQYYLVNNGIDYRTMQQQMEVFCFDKGNLLLINSFPCKQTTDRVYYLLYIWQQLNYNQEKDELHLTGKLEDKEELLKELRNYLRQVFVINPKAEFNRSEISKIEEIPFDMQTLLLCE